MKPTLCQICHEVFDGDWRDHMLDEHREELLRGEVLWFQDVEHIAWCAMRCTDTDCKRGHVCSCSPPSSARRSSGPT